ncbi:MAG: DUF4258 domain-containing protein [Candidatus Brockarchaeota archaeon]|nr:DUF4258 domain-containing protein [Candidatus Brockarchaeota archaeon]
MKIIYTMHALERIRQRKIPFEDILKCIESPGRVIVEHGMSKNIMKTNNNVLIVVLRREDDNIIVITAYRSSRVEKYLS